MPLSRENVLAFRDIYFRAGWLASQLMSSHQLLTECLPLLADNELEPLRRRLVREIQQIDDVVQAINDCGLNEDDHANQCTGT
jgi:hypothetical protein